MDSSKLGYPFRRWDDLSIMRRYPHMKVCFVLERGVKWEDEDDEPLQNVIYLSQALALTAKHAGVTLFHMCSFKSKCKPRDGEYTSKSKRAFGVA
jgi:hypothetical protein